MRQILITISLVILLIGVPSSGDSMEIISDEKIIKSAKEGDVKAQYILGNMYHEEGGGVPQDYQKALKWYKKAAEQGHTSAQIKLGDIYYKGQGVSQDYKKGLKWYKKAAQQGNASAQYNLALKYETGEGVTQHYKKALKWYKKAAEQGHTSAQYNLGLCVEQVEAFPKTIRWLMYGIILHHHKGIKMQQEIEIW